MKTVILICSIICLLAAYPTYGSDQDLWAEANTAYDNNDFETAIEKYHMLLEHGVRKPEVYYNLGGAYFKNNQLGLAIASYHHSLKLDPSFEMAEENLKYIRAFATDKVESKPRGFLLNIWYGLAGLMSPEGHFIFTIAAFWCLALVISAFILRYGKKEILIYLLIFLTILLILSGTVSNFVIGEAVRTRWGVVTAASVELKEGPGEDFEKIFTGHEGLEFRILSRRQGYLLVELANGLKGWIVSSALTEI